MNVARTVLLAIALMTICVGAPAAGIGLPAHAWTSSASAHVIRVPSLAPDGSSNDSATAITSLQVPSSRVAGAPASDSPYSNAQHHQEVPLPVDGPSHGSCPVEGIFSSAPIASFRLAEGSYTGTNFLDACLTVSASRDMGTTALCAGPRNAHEDYRGQEVINGVRYDVIWHGGVATDHIYDIVSYRTLRDDACYDICLFLHYVDIGIYQPGTVSEFDRDAVMGELKDVLYRFRFTES